MIYDNKLCLCAVGVSCIFGEDTTRSGGNEIILEDSGGRQKKSHKNTMTIISAMSCNNIIKKCYLLGFIVVNIDKIRLK